LRNRTFPHPLRLEPYVQLLLHTAQHLRSFSLVQSTRKRSFAFLQPPRSTPWTACAFAGYLCSSLSTGEGPSPWGRRPVYTAFPCSDYYAPSDSPLWHRAFVRRFPLTTSPLLFASTKESPVFTVEDSDKMGEVARSSWPHPRSAAPQYCRRVRQVYLRPLPCLYSDAGRALLAPLLCAFRIAWLTHQARCVRGSVKP
jgi:hypothetical protein